MKKSQARLLRDALTDKSVLVPEAVKFEAIRKYLRNSRWAYAAEVCDTYQSKKETKLVLDIEDALLVLRSANGGGRDSTGGVSGPSLEDSAQEKRKWGTMLLLTGPTEVRSSTTWWQRRYALPSRN